MRWLGLEPYQKYMQCSKIWNFQTISNEEIIKTKHVDIKELDNLVVDNFFIWNLKYSNHLTRNHENRSCRSRLYQGLCIEIYYIEIHLDS